jgi:hypothetical protein
MPSDGKISHCLWQGELKTCSIIAKYFRLLWVKFRKKRIIILNDQLFYFLSTAIVILIVIVITNKHYDQKNDIY